jgi:hypothetical protein
VTHVIRQPVGKPGSSVAVEAPAAAPASATPVAAATKAPTGTDKALEARKKQAESETSAKKRADEEKVAQLRADNCSRARGSKADFESGGRILRTNAQGEREVLDDAQRDAEMRRINAVIAQDCVK